MVTTTATPMSRRRWWLYLAGCIALAAFAVGRPLARGWDAYARAHPVTAIVVSSGQVGQYADAQWRLDAATIEMPESPASGAGTGASVGAGVATSVRARKLPPGTALLRARFTVIPGQATDLKLLSRCRVQVRDRAGRRWDTYGARLGPLPNNCGGGYDASFKQITAKPGEPWTFEVGFLVPDTVVREAEPEIVMPNAMPRYLRLAAPLTASPVHPSRGPS